MCSNAWEGNKHLIDKDTSSEQFAEVDIASPSEILRSIPAASRRVILRRQTRMVVRRRGSPKSRSTHLLQGLGTLAMLFGSLMLKLTGQLTAWPLLVILGALVFVLGRRR